MPKELKTYLALLNVSIPETTIKRTMNNGVHDKVARKKPLHSKKEIAAHLQFVKDHLDKPEGYGESVLWTDDTKIELSGFNKKYYVW